MFGASSVIGPLLGGFMTDHLSWRWVFYVNVPLAILALFVTSAVLPAGTRRSDHRIDYLGSSLLVVVVTSIVPITTWGCHEYERGSPPHSAMIGLQVVPLPILFVVRRCA